MTEENLIGKVKAPRTHYDLLDIVMICLGQKKYNELTGLLSLLNLVLLDNYLDGTEKRSKLSAEFNVEITPELEKGVANMCNLSAGIEERGIERGRREGQAEGKTEMILEMLKEKQPLDLIARVSKFSKEKIAEIGRLHGVL